LRAQQKAHGEICGFSQSACNLNAGDGDGGGIITARFIVFFTVIGLAQIAVGLALVWYSDHEPVRIKRLMVRWKLIDDVVPSAEVTE
jgi:hypothetical protein